VKVLVCGSRKWTNRAVIERRLGQLPPGTIIVHGDCASGADLIAEEVATELGLETRRYPADWSLGKGAGIIRNADMLRREHRSGDPVDLGLAFTEDLRRSRGTRDMVVRLGTKGIKTEVIAE
jgi:hypothetical protein